MTVKVTVKIKNGGGVTFHAKVMGLDVSTKTGVVVLAPEGKVLLAKELPLKPLKSGSTVQRMFRAVELFHVVSDLLITEKPGLVVIEGYGYANAHTLALLVELGTMVRHACIYEQCRYLDVAPPTLKKLVVGVGNAKKDQMRLAVYKKWGYEHPSDNVVDAYALARVGMIYSGMTSPRNAAEKEALRKLKNQ
jgi:crossover junction endodeoxyribonuclease RuvC